VETPRSGCDAIQKNGVRCGKRSIEGTTFCKIHTK
jgi:hypothetical protein